MKYMRAGNEEGRELQMSGLMSLPLLLSLIFLAGFCVVNFAMYFSRMGLTPDSVIAHYLGSEANFTPARTYGSMLETTHMHLPMMSVVLLMLTHLFVLAPFGKPAKAALVIATFLFAFLNEGSPWLVRFVHPGFAVLKITSFLGFQFLLAFMVVSLSAMLLRPARKAMSGSGAPDPDLDVFESASDTGYRPLRRDKQGLSEEAENLLKAHWMRHKEERDWSEDENSSGEPAAELIKLGCARMQDDGLTLTPKGWKAAQSCIRRHRLAERLLEDVLRMDEGVVHSVSCTLEHGLQESVVENICTLLGHPDVCAHGSPIPPGRCCEINATRLRKLVMPLDECAAGEGGIVAYVRSKDPGIMNKLAAMGVLPGQPIRLIRTKPSYLFQMGESQFGIDSTLAKNIYVRTDGTVSSGKAA